ncbi:HDOD domain-containing protein [Pelagicoccus sp. SDUM812005]|uniref:HDOD domain-containing protein n=1 Tax=Pelagicoccus sp. SDUM812005 TaxID=3041257 RepID=UPI0028100308|nr:HDOD domain-containing protein [Pelagicoccus sp. SDUM812005]MDQ8181757.1 HDOD domain-containing protein [Pelagicoccus sp. SDUM812005]
MTTRILIVDEAAQALQNYRDALAPKASQWRIDYADSAAQGLQAAQENTPDVIIAALALADGKGAEILAQLEAIAPDAQRFITATEADKPQLESTFGASFQYLPSPCPAPRLISEIQRCVAIDNWLGNPRIKELVAQMGEFPSLPPIYLKVVSALNSRHADTESIAQAIAGDLAISAKVLQTVNSSFYGFDEKIGNIAETINILGTDCVKNLVLAIQVFNSIGGTADQKAITDELWHHSMSVAVAARRIAHYETRNEKAAEEAYTAGLMHDIGKLVLLNAAPEAFAQARELALEKSIPQIEVETQVLGCNHAETGAYVLARWGMPTNLTEAVALHHDPVNSFGKSFSALAAVHVANAIVHHRQRADHPSSTPSQDFLLEIGRADSWEDWLDVTSGKTPPAKAAAALSLKAQEADTASKSAPAAPQSAKASALQDAAPAGQKKNTKTPFLALAACAALATFGIYILNTIDTVDSTEEAFIQTEEPLAKSALDKARDFSGISQTEDALQEIFDAQAEDDAPSAEPQAAEQPEPALQLTDTAPIPSPALAEPAAELPKPQLPSPRDTFPAIELAGIFYNSERPLASVNGQIRRVGDTVNGAQIVRIDKRQVVVRYENTFRAFKLN